MVGSGHGLILFRGDDRGGLDPYQLTLREDGIISFQITSLTGAASLRAPLPLGQFVHVAGTLDAETGAMRLYLNGMLVSRGVTSVRPFGALDPASNPGVGIGSHGGYPATPHKFLFNGLIDELKLYNHALSQADVLANFNATKGSLQPAISISDGSGVEGQVSVKYLGNFIEPQQGGLDDPHQMIFGPDGNLYVSTLQNSSVLRYHAGTGAPLPAPGKSGAEFVSPNAGGLEQARGIAFGPDGHMYVASATSNAILRFDGTTGQSLGALIAAGAGGLYKPRGLLFHQGYIYVTSIGEGTPAVGMDAILRYDAYTGAPAGKSGVTGDAVFIPSGDHGLDNPSNIVFYNGDFYVASSPGSVLRYAANGTFRDAFVPTSSGGLSGPIDLDFQGGFLYVTSVANNKVLRYNGITGAIVDEVASAGGLYRPNGLLFEPSGNFLVASGDSDEIRRYSQAQADFRVSFTVTIAPWPTTVTVDFSTANGSALTGTDYVSNSGSITFAPGIVSRTIHVQTLDDAVSELTEAFVVNLSNALGAVIADGQGIGTIFDNDTPPTKFYVVDDATANKTFEYAGTGAAIENYSLGSGNTAPRGAASNVTGDKVWVVDVNKTVYVYNTSGGRLGSWTAGSLVSNAMIEGITTNGTDVWIVDSKSNKVFKYTGAASRLSGSQTAASSFSLNGSNTTPTDLVTDGSSIWVLNDTQNTDKVFKYSVSGSLLGSWTITSGGGSPTGLTIDPTNVSNIWIVDNNTDRVYQFNSATSLTSGSASPSSSFALTAGNTNPQGIADPPPAASMLVSQTSTIASNVAAPELEKPNRKALASSDPFIAQVDTIFENWNEDGLFSKTQKRLAGRR